MTVLTPSPNPTNLLTPTHVRALLSALSPVLTNTLSLFATLQTLLHNGTLFLLFRSYFLLRQSFLVSQILLYGSSILLWQYSSILGKGAYWTTKFGVKEGYKRTAWLRKKLQYEFFVFILGGGNPILLVVFWPGWLVVMTGVWGAWWVCG